MDVGTKLEAGVYTDPDAMYGDVMNMLGAFVAFFEKGTMSERVIGCLGAELKMKFQKFWDNLCGPDSPWLRKAKKMREQFNRLLEFPFGANFENEKVSPCMSSFESHNIPGKIDPE
jgi:hypothetical protein